MTKQAVSASKGSSIHELDRLRLRISAMVGSPKAQADRRAVIWRLDSDTDEAWSQVMDELSETDGLVVTKLEDGTAVLEWQTSCEESEMGGKEIAEAEIGGMQRAHEETAPF
ncbi:DUF1654 domain-containing protein [Pseudomonas sp. PDM18]|uniref:DUF1654 domain-containing protein n=1 Tax=Pseudomonas sp. PDM18 TaxID=2769253 RepID=UPI001781462D|nr:DUF1654 domain-containing protein [Pseudomonas sp. PDM18]MBD9675559.1 DUF1654 domain-containing protein [Pseudomonas sp. PDM18]